MPLARSFLYVPANREKFLEKAIGLPSDAFIFDLEDSVPPAEKENARDGADAGKRERAETMLEAHEALCEAAPENLSRFKDVLDYLKQDLHQTTAGK